MDDERNVGGIILGDKRDIIGRVILIRVEGQGV